MNRLAKKAALLFLTSFLFNSSLIAAEKQPPPKVSINFYAMSLCPFCVETENALLPIVKAFGDNVNFQIHYISSGAVNSNGEVTAFRSLNGSAESVENFRQLCIRRDAPDKLIDYIMERNKDYRSQDWHTAAKKAGIPTDAIESCLASHEGVRLFFEDTTAHILRRVFSSPSWDINGVFYNGDGSPRSMATAVCKAFPEGMSPQICSRLSTFSDKSPSPGSCVDNSDKPPAFTISVVNDASCRFCSTSLLEPLRRQHPGAEINVFDINSKEGAALVKKHSAMFLPFYLLSKGVEVDPNFSTLEGTYYRKSGEDYMILLGPNTYAPNVNLARPRIPGHLDIFVSALSEKTYWAESDLFSFLKDTPSKNITFSIHFVVPKALLESDKTAVSASTGTVRSASAAETTRIDMRAVSEGKGSYELTETLRQLCIFQKTSLENFFSYMVCRKENVKDPFQWQKCFIPNDQVTKCMEKGEGMSLLKSDADMLLDFPIYSANLPIYVWENRYGPFIWEETDWRWLINPQYSKTK